MKKIITLFLLCGTLMTASAQKIGFWFDAGVKAGIGTNYLINSNIQNDASYKHLLTSGYSLGAKFGIFKGRYNGITFDLMYNKGGQEFRNEASEPHVNHAIDWTSTDFAVLYRLQKEGIYVELGPMFSFMNSVTDTYGTQETEVLDAGYYNDQLTSAVFGFGGYLLGGGQFTLMFGIRASYGFTDMISDSGQTANYPNPNAADVPYESYSSSNPLNVSLIFEANFGLGYFAKTTCKDRMTFFRFD